MTTDEVLGELLRRGLTVKIDAEGRTVISGQGSKFKVTANLLAVLRWHKDELVKRLQVWRPREWLTEDGFLLREAYIPDDPDEMAIWQNMDAHPKHCVSWRFVGEEKWRKVPCGTNASLTDSRPVPSAPAPVPGKPVAPPTTTPTQACISGLEETAH